jgi:hypothetical protein
VRLNLPPSDSLKGDSGPLINQIPDRQPPCCITTGSVRRPTSNITTEDPSLRGNQVLASEGEWPIQEGGNCYECADQIQDLIGGRVGRIRPPEGAPKLGPSVHNPEGDWGEHVVIVKGGRIYDGTTGPEGLPADEYKGQFENEDVIEFAF